MNDWIKIHGAKENNLKNISLSIPRNKLVVLTGLSGSGKSTLAMDTLQKECQRQYMDSLGMTSDYISKPKVDSIEGLSPSICIDQHHTNRSPRSTVGTTTELYTYLRVLFAKLGDRLCTNCGEKVTPDFYSKEGMDIWEESYGSVDEDESIPMEYSDLHLKKCHACNYELKELTISHFSFNKPEGACPTCMGLGVEKKPNLENIFNNQLSIKECAIKGSNPHGAALMADNLVATGKYYGFEFDPDKPLKDLDQIERDLLYYGVHSLNFMKHFPDKLPPVYATEGRFEGIITNLQRRYKERGHEHGYREKIEKFFHLQECSNCKGTKLKLESRQVRVADRSIQEVAGFSLFKLHAWLCELSHNVPPEGADVVNIIVEVMKKKLIRLMDVGVGYLSLDRSTVSLSVGENQRFKLASLIGAGLTGVLYILDEPTIGLHQSDTQGLIKVLRQLRDLGNTVLVIEHDVEIMREADYIIDIGPDAGQNGGEVVVAGSVQQVECCAESWTGRHLSGKDSIRIPDHRRKGNGKFITIEGATKHNLKNLDVKIPLGKLVVLTGISGSGKSTLAFDILAQSAQQYFKETSESPNCKFVIGWENVQKVIGFDQTPIGKTARSNAATYTDVYTSIRNIYASLPESKRMKLNAKHFSFNIPGGRCERCQGSGLITVNLQFLPDFDVPCPVCRKKRFKPEVLNVKYKGHSIADLLDMPVRDVMELFVDEPLVYNKLSVMSDIGLDYLILGQSATTLSGGEAQRVKLARELSKRSKHHTMYLLDEPTTGLHPHDVLKLIETMGKLVDSGNSVVVVEHHTDVIAMADWIIDMGPGGGLEGGQIVGQGTPEQLVGLDSKTAKVLKSLLNKKNL